MEFLHSDRAIYGIVIRYKSVSKGETSFLEHRMEGDTPLNKNRLSTSDFTLMQTERIVSCAGVFSQQMYSLMLTTNYSKTQQVNDFHKYYEQSFETRYDFEVNEGIAFINAGFLSSFIIIRIYGRNGLSEGVSP